MSFSSLSINDSRAINNLSKYVIGAEINRQEEPSGIVGGVGLMGGISGGTWLFKNRKNIKGGFQQLAGNAAEQKRIVNSVKKYPPNAIFSNARNKWAGATEYLSKGELEALSAKLAKKPEYAKLKNHIDAALKSGKNYAQTLKDVEKLKAIEKLNVYNAKVATQMANGSKLRALKNATGITKLSTATKELAVKSGKFRGLIKGIKGNAGFAAISLGIGVVCDVVPAFQLGTDKGFKQLGKTAAKTGAEVAGWWAGSALGAKAGAAIGTAIGGPVGTVVGGLIGLIGGFAGSYFASKAADKIIGPNEVELAQQKGADEIAKNAKTDFNTLDEVAQQAYIQLLEHAQTGQLTEDDITAKQSLEQLLGKEIDLNAELQAFNQTPQENPPVQTNSQIEAQQQTVAKTEITAPNNSSEQNENISNNYQNKNPYSMPFGNVMTNPYSNDMFYQNLFGFTQNPYLMNFNMPMGNAYQTPDSGLYFKYTG